MEWSSFMGDFICPKCGQEYDEDESDNLDYLDTASLICFECGEKFTVRKKVKTEYLVNEVIDES